MKSFHFKDVEQFNTYTQAVAKQNKHIKLNALRLAMAKADGFGDVKSYRSALDNHIVPKSNRNELDMLLDRGKLSKDISEMLASIGWEVERSEEYSVWIRRRYDAVLKKRVKKDMFEITVAMSCVPFESSSFIIAFDPEIEEIETDVLLVELSLKERFECFVKQCRGVEKGENRVADLVNKNKELLPYVAQDLECLEKVLRSPLRMVNFEQHRNVYRRGFYPLSAINTLCYAIADGKLDVGALRNAGWLSEGDCGDHEHILMRKIISRQNVNKVHGFRSCQRVEPKWCSVYMNIHLDPKDNKVSISLSVDSDTGGTISTELWPFNVDINAGKNIDGITLTLRDEGMIKVDVCHRSFIVTAIYEKSKI